MSQIQKQTSEQKKREKYLDEDWMSDVAYVFHHFESCKELEDIWSSDWRQCPMCGADVKDNGTITHVKQ